MSTKIYNGLELEYAEPYMMQQRFRRLQKDLKPVAVRITAEFVGQEAANWIDDFAWHGETMTTKDDYTKSSYAMTYAIGKLWERQREQYKQFPERDIDVDVRCELAIYPLKGRYLAQIFCEQDEMTKIVKNRRWVKEYHYQNQTDRPDGISEQEWTRRRDDWDKTFTDIAVTPKQAGWMVSLADFPPMVQSPDVLPNLPKFEARCKRIADNVLFGDWLKEEQRKSEKASDLLQNYRDYTAWMKGPGEARRQDLLQRVQKRLVPTITQKTLMADWQTQADKLYVQL